MKHSTALILTIAVALFACLVSELELTSTKRELEATRMKLERCRMETYDRREEWVLVDTGTR
jgi:hypothetical protein